MIIESKQNKGMGLFEGVGGFQVLLNQKISQILTDRISDDGEYILPGSSRDEYCHNFVKHYNKEYVRMNDLVGELTIDTGSSTIDFTNQEEIGRIVEKYTREFDKAKYDVMNPVFDLLGPEVIEASRTTSGLTDLMHRKQVDNERFLQIVHGLVQWHALDDLYQKVQAYLRPHVFSLCFGPFAITPGRKGRPVENFYEQADKERLRHTLEALYQEKYTLSLTQGWCKNQKQTMQFLVAFHLSLLRDAYGKAASFRRFLKEVCGYGFVPAARTFQHWFSGYRDFVRERERHPMREPSGARARSFAAVEALVEWIRSRLPHYGVSIA